MKLQPVIQPNEEVRVGDVVRMWGEAWATVVEIRPYQGPLTDIIFAIAQTQPKHFSFSLERGGYSEVIRGHG